MNDHLDMQTPNGVSQNIEKIAQLFPHCVTETHNGLAIDFDLLKQELSQDIVEGIKERYRLEWPGKREAITMANLPTQNTLRPEPAQSVDFDKTQNLYIEGDNLEVLKLLQESYLGKVKMIYIDPPYNTGKDFVYKDNFTQDTEEYQSQAGLRDEQNNRLVANPDTSGRYHSDWLTMMYPRLKLARNLLTDDGVIFISIDDNEVHNLRKICDEIFGEMNFVAELIWKSKSGGANDSKFFAVDHEYVICYTKNASIFDLLLDVNATVSTNYNLEDEIGRYSLDRLDKQSLGYLESLDFPIIGTDNKIYLVEHINPNIKVARWRWGKETVKERYNELVFKNGYVYTKNYQKKGSTPRSLLIDERFGRTRTGKTDFTSLFETIYFSAPKPSKLILFLISISTDKNSLILDFFSGSATTAHAVMQLNAEDGGNRKYIMVQLPENIEENTDAHQAGYKTICDIGKERIRRAAKKIQAEKVEKAKKDGLFAGDFKDEQDYGFRVYKLDTSNMEDVFYLPKDLEQNQLDLFADNLKPDRSPLDLLTQIMLDWGLPLSLPVEKTTIAGKEVFRVNQDALFACFDNGIDETFAKEIAQHKPLRIVFRDRSFKDDTAKENVKQLLHQLAPETEMKVL